MTISPDTFQFLADLKLNNNRDWFQENKPRYEAAKEEFTQFVDHLIERITEFDPSIGHHSAKGCVFRIYRDVRFSKDKSPYKTNFGAHITSAIKRSDIHSRAGYYLHLSPGDSMLAGGAYMPKGDWLKNIRQSLDLHGDEFRAILANKEFQKYFGELEGEQLKRAPKGYDVDHPEIELLRYKSFLGSHRMKDVQVLDPGFLDHAANAFQALFPFDEFLNQSAV